MKYKFFIMQCSNNIATGEATFFPVYIQESNEYLKFDTYENAEKWIEEQRALSSDFVYQIVKFYI